MKDNYNNNNNEDKTNSNDNKEIKFNYFGGSFGERQRTNGALGSSGTTASAGPNDHNSRKNSQSNVNNNNNFMNHLLSTDLGTVSDANKKMFNKEENGNTNRMTSPRQTPMVVTLSTTTDSEHYRSKQHSFNSPFNKPVIQSSDFISVRNNNNNNRITYESTHSEQYLPSAAPEKSYLLPPPITIEIPSSPPPQKTYTNVRHTPVHTLPASINSRPAVKWPKKQNTESYVTERVRFEMTTAPPPPPPPPVAPPRQYKPSKDDFTQKTFEPQSENVWPEKNYNGNYHEQTKYAPVHHQQSQPPPPPQVPVQPPKHIQTEQIELSHPKWSPIGQTVHTFGKLENNQNFRPNRQQTNGPHNSWTNIELVPQQQHHQPHQQKQQPNRQQEREQFLQNEEKTYNYPAIHHTIEPSAPVDNHLWSADDRPVQQTEEDYRPKNRNYNSQSIAPLKPKWAQELMSEADQLPPLQTLTQPLMQQSSQPQIYQKSRISPKIKNHAHNRKALKLSETDIFGSQPPISSFDMTLNDYFNLRPTKPTQFKMNAFYDQLQPYSFAENSPPEYVKKLSESDKQMIGQNFNQNDEQIKEKSKTNLKPKPKNQNQNPTKTPTLNEELKFEKDYKDFNIPSDSGKLSGYVPEILPDFMTEEEFPLTMPETHIIPKMHKQKPKSMTAKHNPNRYNPSKIMNSNILDELLTGEANNWALKHLDTSGLEAAFSHSYPMMPLSFPTPKPKKFPKIPKTSYPSSMATHMNQQNRFLLGAPLPPRPMPMPSHMPQPTFYMPQPMAFTHQLQAQQTMPFPYYMPYFPTAQHSAPAPVFKSPKNTNKPTKSKSNNSPKIFKF